MNQSRYANIVRIGAIYDIVATLPFAVPLLSAWAFQLLQGSMPGLAWVRPSACSTPPRCSSSI